jgi:hypothetical protein
MLANEDVPAILEHQTQDMLDAAALGRRPAEELRSLPDLDVKSPPFYRLGRIYEL